MAKTKPKKEKFVKPLYAKPITKKQTEYFKAIKNSQVTVAIGPAGTGKTICPLSIAAKALDKGEIDQIILTKPNVSASRELGYLPGDQNEKLMAWLAEPIKILTSIFGKNALECMLKKETIYLVPFEKMRGMTFDDCFVLLDECQNVNKAEMELFTTRIGENAKVVIEGDYVQSDLPKNMRTGLDVILDMINAYSLPVPVIEFTEEDVCRSGICKEFTLAWNKYKRDNV